MSNFRRAKSCPAKVSATRPSGATRRSPFQRSTAICSSSSFGSNALSKAKVESSDIYQQIQDKWSEQMYLAIHKILNEQQWEKYLKQGAAREKKARDKRANKRK